MSVPSMCAWKGQQRTASGVVPREPSTLGFFFLIYLPIYFFVFKLNYFDFSLLFCVGKGSTCMHMAITLWSLLSLSVFTCVLGMEIGVPSSGHQAASPFTH